MLEGFTRASRALDDIADDTPEAIRQKKELFEQSHADPAWRRQREACDLWTAAFFSRSPLMRRPITTATLAEYLAGRPNSRLVALAWDLSLTHPVLPLAAGVPGGVRRGGFDCVLGNPPWERVKIQEKEWFRRSQPGDCQREERGGSKELMPT